MSVKGWCPGALRPMESGDGLIVRVRTFAGVLSPRSAAGLAEASVRCGNGLIDLTNRANIQLRGVRTETLAKLQGTLDDLGLLDDDPAYESVRNIVASPLAGFDPTLMLDVHRIVAALEDALKADPRLHALPAKFGFMVDGGGVLPLKARPFAEPDIGLIAAGEGRLTLEAAGRAVATLPEAAGPRAAIELAVRFLEQRAAGARRMRDVVSTLIGPLPDAVGTVGRHIGNADAPDSASARPRAGLSLPTGPAAVAGHLATAPFALAAAPFGSLQARQLADLARLADRVGGSLRLTPWRALVVTGTADDEPIRALGLLTSLDDPLLRVDACAGAPSCRSAEGETRDLARRLAAVLSPRATLHVSGCAKGCARRSAAGLSVTAHAGRYGIAMHARADAARLRDGLSAEALLSEVAHVPA